MALDLNRRQRRMADLIMRIGARRGIPQNRLGELAFAAYKESGLNPQAVNPSSGAAGLFQLLSSGYVNRANELGGVTNPRANILSILPSYKKYWQQNPQAAAGAAGRDVERSGLGAEWYAPTQQFRSALGSLPTHPNNQTLRPQPGIDPPRIDRSALMGEIMEMFQTTQETGQVDVSGVIGAYREMMDVAQQQPPMRHTPGAATGTTVDETPESGAASSVLQAASKQIGKPYVWGGETPQEGGFDCSGLIDWAYKQAGIDFPGRLTTYTAARLGKPVNLKNIKAGDLIISNGGRHMTMYVGGGKVIAAPHRGENVQYQPLSQFKGDIVGIRRVL